MADPKVQIGNIGTKLILEVQEDGVAINISSATGIGSKVIRVRKPETKTVVAYEAEFATDGLDGLMQYVTVANDLNEEGVWKWQGFVKLTSPVGEWNSEIKEFQVKNNLVVTA